MARAHDFDLARAARAPSFTPARGDLAALVTLLLAAGDDDVAHLQAALLRADPRPVREALAAALAGAAARAGDGGGGARLIAALGGLGKRDDDARALVIATLADPASPPRARRAAAVALGKIGGDAARAALIAYWDAGELAPDHRRAVAEALGKVGGDDAIARLRAAAPGDDALLGRRRDRAILMAERTASRRDDSEVAMDVAPPHAIAIVARCRAGLEDLLIEELRVAGLVGRAAGRGVVALTTTRPLGELWRARTMLGAGVDLALPRAATLAESIAAALTADATVALLTALTRGPIRWRLDFAAGGHRRAVVWETAQRVAERRPALVNDPSATTWDVIVEEDARRLELRPRRFDDPRFAWRARDVPAASHPTIAAALARIAGAHADDVVWDPFVGSGAELIERARLGPYARLIGSDLDPRALGAARANLDAAGVRAELTLGDALALTPEGVTLVITNPPLGRRIRGDAPTLLEKFAAHAARLLVPGGRLVWISPVPKRTERALTRAGMTLGARRAVDLGGFEAAMERWERPR